MYALTLWQPWLYCITHRGKRAENRPWRPPALVLGTRIALHAAITYRRAVHREVDELCARLGVGALPDRDALTMADYYGTVVGTATVTGVASAPGQLPPDQVGWWKGPLAWMLDDVRLLERPVRWSGSQKLWRIPRELNTELEAQNYGQVQAVAA